jgi:hypothetical protein
VESSQPGKPSIGLLESRRVFYGREARAFAAESLMPFNEAGDVGLAFPRGLA